MKSTLNNLTDRKTFISQYDLSDEMSHTNNIMDRNTFIRPENRNMRNELLERHSKIGTQEKSKIGVRFWMMMRELKVSVISRTKNPQINNKVNINILSISFSFFKFVYQ